MTDQQSPPGRGHPRDNALQLHRVMDTWRRVALVHAFDEVDSLSRADEQPTSGHAVDLSAQASRRLRAASRNETSRAFSIRSWSDPDTPQKGRSSEFWAVSCRIFDDESVRADAETIACAVETLRALGVSPQQVKVRISHRDAVRSLLIRRGVDVEQLDAWFPLLHRAGKMSNDDFISGALELGMEAKTALDVLRVLAMSTPFENPTTQLFLSEQAGGRGPGYFKSLFAELRAMGVAEWCVLNLGIVRAGVHHSGMVFEIHDASGRGRSVAGGGRSEFEGEETVHAVGFEMGDTSLLDLLRDAALLPDTRSLVERLGARTDAIVGAIDDPDALGAVVSTAAALRRAGFRTHRIDSPVASMSDLRKHAHDPGHSSPRRAILIESGHDAGVAHVVDLDTGVAHPQPVPLNRLPDFLRS
jgi:histidyl-tRNA synthetase